MINLSQITFLWQILIYIDHAFATNWFGNFNENENKYHALWFVIELQPYSIYTIHSPLLYLYFMVKGNKNTWNLGPQHCNFAKFSEV